MAILKDLFITKGMSAIDSIYQSQIAQGDIQPFSMSFYNDFKNWLAWKKAPEYKNRMQLYKLAVESYPNLARNNYLLAYYLKKNKLDKLALDYSQKTQQLLPKDSSLTQKQKRTLEKYIAEDLQ